jgi:hypothetical protein
MNSCTHMRRRECLVARTGSCSLQQCGAASKNAYLWGGRQVRKQTNTHMHANNIPHLRIHQHCHLRHLLFRDSDSDSDSTTTTTRTICW